MIESAAFAHWGWVRDETQAPKGAAEHWGGAGDETLAVDPSRGEKADHVVGGVSNPHGLVYALAGDDRVTGGELTDLLYGGAGGDRLEGGAGGDWLFGGPGDDLLEGGAGDDVLIDPEGANSLTGGAGNDHLEGSGTLDGGEGEDVLTATGEGTTLTGGPGSDRFLPPLRGRITFADFTPGEDRLDLSLLQTPDRAPTLELRGADGETTLVWGDLAVTMPGVTGLTEADLGAAPFDVAVSFDVRAFWTPPAPEWDVVARVLRPGGTYVANVADGPPLRYARGQVATLRAVFGSVCLLAEPGTMRGRRFGNLVALASDGELPLAGLTRACARDPMPSRVVDGADLERFAGKAQPVTDDGAQPSPEPPAGVFGR